jgi:hypothetical protein
MGLWGNNIHPSLLSALPSLLVKVSGTNAPDGRGRIVSLLNLVTKLLSPLPMLQPVEGYGGAQCSPREVRHSTSVVMYQSVTRNEKMLWWSALRY